MSTKKLVVVGDDACGKTCLLLIAAIDGVPKNVPRVAEDYVIAIKVDEVNTKLALYDTHNQYDYDRLRPLRYPETDVVLICFSVVSLESLENVSIKWWPEIKKYCRGIPVILVGTKSDLRNDQGTLEILTKENKRLVYASEAEAVAKQIGALCYLECSAKKRLNVDEIFIQAARATLRKQSGRKRCTLI